VDVREKAALHTLHVAEPPAVRFALERIQHRPRDVDRDNAVAQRSNIKRQRAGARTEVHERRGFVQAELAQTGDVLAWIETSLAVVAGDIRLVQVLWSGVC
jgi:hypothetical protein